MIDATDNVTRALPDVEPAWMVLLKGAIAAVNGRGGVTLAAQRMGISRTYVARVLMTGENRIKTPSQKFIDRAMDTFGQVDCPHLQQTIKPGECQAYATREWKVIHGSGPEKVLHWRACQHCPKNAGRMGSAPEGNS